MTCVTEKEPRRLLADVLGNLSLNDIPFTILRAATSDEEEELKVSLIEIDERFSALDSMMESRNIPNVSQFYKKKTLFHE